MTVHYYHGIRSTDPQGLIGLRNPERGFRTETLIGEGEGTTTNIWGPAFCVKGKTAPFFTYDWWVLEARKYEPFGVTLAQTYCYLTEFADKPLSKHKLNLLQRSFDSMRNNGFKCLLRFAYEKENTGVEYGPTLAWILKHIEQLKPIIRQNTDVIYVVQTGFIGAWGEWHNATHIKWDDYDSQAKVLKAVLDMVPGNRMIQIRTPKVKNILMRTPLFNTAGSTNTFPDGVAGRIGFHNDGFLIDDGTFSSKQEFNQQTLESPYVPIDGELFWSDQGWDLEKQTETKNNPVDGLAAAIEMRLQHYTSFSLSHSYSGREGKNYSIDRWMATPITEEQLKKEKMPISDGYFQNQFGNKVERTQFEYIRDHLGYRLELQTATFPEKLKMSDELTVDLELINRGFATLYNPRNVYVVLIDTNGEVSPFNTNTNVKKWQPFNPDDKNYMPLKHHFGIRTKLPANIEPGWYQLGLWMPDSADSIHFNPRYAIKLADRDTLWWINDRGEYGINLLGVIEVK